MSGIKGNRRTLYTKKVIKESLIELLQVNDIHQITVTNICNKAESCLLQQQQSLL